MQQTSLLAYQGAQINLGRKQQLVLEAIEEIGPASNKQIATHLKWAINSVTPRTLELRQKNKVEASHIGIESGRRCIFWKASDLPPEDDPDELPEREWPDTQ